MKKYLIPITFLVLSLNLYSQGNRDRVKALKVAFITEKLSLTEKEAQSFWPIYNTYDDNSTRIKYNDMRKLRRDIKESINTLDDNKAKVLLDKLIETENSLHYEETQLISKLRKVISPKKILLLKTAEDDFNRKLFEEYKKKRRGDSQNK
ncbi:hypothetical protein APS56_15180 [Pseudalgibacter alginicilyticus]|uniref:Sensor of ECF-type sigma factor n=1 Tax=Pseudalgibacter alginicilyticus TaxID=1736674 RepID=A0A0P0CJJ8_9FLAO|nr:hypothetical protein [Pseudalgibacter alginicilyticus]ALJ06395.1 hypothetical protein APS56_15180 [Pseudalgibacter alginicilyticus]